ncbi:beta-galactosidase [Cohnella hashimotonis]|uniref:Beta-galactosidase n=1 Tax=Cohnella hashimotonis TaxID=2826895 RepID=A0ABT6TMS6_9BACL|nr:beta-galactosidase [Cohnella hashimotonis]MDI4648014.1 beta-galactosidase [Cohnella hashimotonis]
MSKADFVGAQTFPVGMWVPPPASEISVERYKEIRDGGFTFVIGFREIEDGEETVIKALDCAEANGLKYLVSDPRVKNLALSELSEMGPLVAPYSAHPAYMGHLFFDEPGAEEFERLAALADNYYAHVPDGLAYVNLLPTYAKPPMWGTDTYADYVERFLSTFKPKVLSYDHYPLLMNKNKPDYFANLWSISEACRRHDVPFWLFIQTLSFNGKYREPNEAELRWQVNLSLAFGAVGIQYFTYWSPDDWNNETFGEALIRKDGSRTEQYDRVKRINEELAVVGQVLQSLRPEGILVRGEIPDGVERVLPSFGPVAGLEGDPVVAGCFSADGEPDSLFVVNLSHDNQAESIIVFDQAPSVTIRLEPGAGKLIRLRETNGA